MVPWPAAQIENACPRRQQRGKGLHLRALLHRGREARVILRAGVIDGDGGIPHERSTIGTLKETFS